MTTISVIQDPDTGEHVALANNYPSLSWIADTPQAALKGMQELLNNINNDQS